MIRDMLDIRNDHIAKELASGKQVSEIAAEHSLTPAAISSIAKKKRSREIIEQETKKLLSIVPDITEQLVKDVQLSGKLTRYLADPSSEPDVATSAFGDTEEILKFQNLAYKKQQDVMKAVGIFPTNSTNIFIQQIYNDNRKQVLSAEVFQALGGIFSQTDNEAEDIEDAEIINKLNAIEEDDPEDEDND